MLTYYWVGIKLPKEKKTTRLVGGMDSLLIFTVAYPLSVYSVDQFSRPYIGRSQTNSLMELAFGYKAAKLIYK